MGLRTLVVDDSSSMRGLLRELLRERNYQVTVLGSAEEALEAHRQQPFELMLVDWTLPGLSGLDLCREVRATPGGEDVFILMITGRDRTEDLTAVIDAGASDYLSKPIDPRVLSTRLLIAERTLADGAKQRARRKEMESRLAFADRMASVGTLAAGVAHELNNPLLYVLSNLRLTREDLEAADPADWTERAMQQLDEAIQGAVRMQNIVRDLKTFSRPDEQPNDADLREVLESAINICSNEVRHQARLERDFGKTPPVAAAESRLVQVFVNLLINAAQAMPDRAAQANRIVIRTRTDEEGLAVVEVIDNGTGIEPDRLSRVFDPFFTTKGLSEGTGLGLSICRNIVEDAGGTIEAQSEVGAGTTFVVRLPASDRPKREKPTTSVQRAPAVGARARVVVVDDEPLVGRSIRRALRGHEVQVFSNGQEAIERLCSGEPFDLVLCDLMMPDVSGMEVFGKVSARRPDLASRFVFMTGGAFTARAREFLKETSVPCLEKPFELNQIRELVRERTELVG